MSGNLEASISDIRGDIFSVTITYDNGYAIKVGGELFPGSTFIAYKSNLKQWLPPHDNEILNAEMKAKLIADVEKQNLPGRVKVVFQ